MILFDRWLTKRAKAKVAQQRAPSVPVGMRVYAIGDVHGRYDLLLRLLDLIQTDSRERGGGPTELVFLGDLIDRGPQSADVVAHLLECPPAFARCHFILGNHEEALIDSVRGPGEGRAGWLTFGGLETLESYGIAQATSAAGGIMLDQALQARIPAAHIDFIQSFHDSIHIGDYLFVHAGIRPGVALDRQDPHDLRWIRAEFLRDMSDHGAMVVHGHTISEHPEFRPNRIGIDTGAYRTGTLTSLGLEGEDRWIIAT